MQMTIKVEASEIVQAINNLSAAVGLILAAKAEARPEAGAEKEVARVKPKLVAPTPAPAAEPAAPAAPTEQPAPATPAPASNAPAVLTYTADVAPTMGRLLTEKGAGLVKELLATFGVKKGVELAPDQLVPALARAKELLNG